MQDQISLQHFSLHQYHEENNLSLTALPLQPTSAQTPKQLLMPNKLKKIRKQKIPNHQRSIPTAIPVLSSTKVWELQYFYCALLYSLDYPLYNLTWQSWKYDRYYQEIANSLAKLMLPHCFKNGRQVKSKDQGLKKKYFLVQNPIDILEISEKEVRREVLRLKRLQLQTKVDESSVQRQRRYENILNRINDNREQQKSKKIFQLQYEKLHQFSRETSSIIEELANLHIR